MSTVADLTSTTALLQSFKADLQTLRAVQVNININIDMVAANSLGDKHV
jgi:hypothetical protein